MSSDRGHSRGRRNQGNFRSRNKNRVNVGDKAKEVLENINENNPVIKQFQAYALELDTKHDRLERIVKVSRDITIESKRIIFLLHTIDRESKRDSVLEEAENRINNLTKVMFKNIAQELDGEDPYLYLRAYKPGLQEFVEALTFYWFLKNNTLYHWTGLESSMTYTIDKPLQTEQSEQTTEEPEKLPVEQKSIKTLIPPIDYILGIADLTGELMRKSINNLGSGDIASCFETCNFVREIYKGFLGCLGISGREVGRKLFTLRQSLQKIENVCYVIKVRGSEMPKHMLADVAFGASEDINMDDDEGYQAF